MNQILDFKFVAVAEDSFKVQDDEAHVRRHANQHIHDDFLSYRSDSKHIEIYSLEREKFLDLCEQFPKAAARM